MILITKESTYSDEELYNFLEKSADESGTVNVDALVFAECKSALENGYMVMSDNTLDDASERVDPAGWVLDRYRANPILLWSHDRMRPAIGKMEDVKVVNGQLVGKPVFDITSNDEFANMIAKKFESGVIKAGSVGFRPIKITKKTNADGKQEVWITQQELGEFSLVNLPSNPAAVSSKAASTIKINRPGLANARSLIAAGKIDRGESWSFTADDGNAILGDDNWTEYGRWFLAVDDSIDKEAKEHYKYPFGKDGKIYRRAVIAIESRASTQGLSDVSDSASKLLAVIDEKKKSTLSVDSSWMKRFYYKEEREVSRQTSDLENLFSNLGIETLYSNKQEE